MTWKDLVKESLVKLLDGAQPVIERGDTLTIGKLRIQATESGYANITLNRPLDISFVRQFFKDFDVYTEDSQGSVIIKKNANIFLYAEPGGKHRISFGPVLDFELLLLVFRYIRTLFQDLEPQ
ncbi:MAG: hypothetical protein ACFFCO_00265 [Promethearchaeota archaeon]